MIADSADVRIDNAATCSNRTWLISKYAQNGEPHHYLAFFKQRALVMASQLVFNGETPHFMHMFNRIVKLDCNSKLCRQK